MIGQNWAVLKNYGLVESDYSTVSKKAKEVSFEIFKELFVLVCSRCNRNIRRQLNFPLELLLVDSTTITVGKTELLWAPYHGQRAGIKLHTALNLSTELPHIFCSIDAICHLLPPLAWLRMCQVKPTHPFHKMFFQKISAPDYYTRRAQTLNACLPKQFLVNPKTLNA